MILWTVIPNEDEATQQYESAKTTVLSRIPETYCWMMVPTQESPDADETMNPIQTSKFQWLGRKSFSEA